MDDISSAKQLRIIKLFSGVAMLATLSVLFLLVSGGNMKAQLTLNQQSEDPEIQMEGCFINCRMWFDVCRLNAAMDRMICMHNVGDQGYCEGIYTSAKAVCDQQYESCKKKCGTTPTSPDATGIIQ